jgi:hypothetical protein
MLHTNLSTGPFYNERVAQIGLGVAALLVVAFTLFNVLQWRSLSERHAQLLSRVGGDERAAAMLRIDAERARRSLDRAELERVAAASREANALIDRRVFSWTGMLNGLEASVPANVRVLSIRPVTDHEGKFTITIVAVGRRAEDIEQFVEHLEAAGSFQRLVLRSETTNQQGLLEVVLEGRYDPVAPPKPAVAANPAAGAGRKK